MGSGGAQRRVANLAVLLKKAGHEIKLLVYGKQDFFYEKLNENNIQIDIVGEKNYFQRFFKVRKYIRKGWQDVVISFLDTPNFLSNISSIKKRKWKIITNECNANIKKFSGIKNRIYKYFEKKSDALVCNSNNAKRMWIDHYPEYKDKIQVIYNPVDAVCEDNYQTRKNGKTEIVVAARYEKQKNIDNLLEALIILPDSFKEKIIISWYGGARNEPDGSSEYEKAIKKITLHKLGNVIKLIGETKEIYSAMKTADIVGLFSSREGMPNAICEAMFLSKPIIMTRVSDFEILIDENNGFLCDWDNPASITEALKKTTVKTDEELIKMGEYSKTKAKKLFATKKIINEWLELINGV